MFSSSSVRTSSMLCFLNVKYILKMNIQIFLLEDFVICVNVTRQDSFQHCFLCSFLHNISAFGPPYEMRHLFSCFIENVKCFKVIHRCVDR